MLRDTVSSPRFYAIKVFSAVFNVYIAPDIIAVGKCLREEIPGRSPGRILVQMRRKW
jgi:hypothetical protein